MAYVEPLRTIGPLYKELIAHVMLGRKHIVRTHSLHVGV